MESEDLRRRAEVRCPVCEMLAERIGEKAGRWRRRQYHLARCSGCGFSFVTDPDTDFAAIYNADYYRGKGADPLVDYERDVKSAAGSARLYELRGLLGYAASAMRLQDAERWLDFGSGLGGFVTYLRSEGIDAYGYDEGYAASEAHGRGVPMLKREKLDEVRGTFGVVSAIEVLEHVLNPVETVRQIAGLLRPGGLFLYTTGNAEPFRNRLTEWSYVVPEIHVSFYEPRTIRTIFQQAQLIPLQPACGAALADIIRYKIMKNIRIGRRSILDRILPWPILTRLADQRYEISSMILGVKAASETDSRAEIRFKDSLAPR